MSATSSWSWSLTLRVPGGYQENIPGQTIAPATATQETILPGILDDLSRGELRGVNFSVVSFSATRIA